VVSRNLILFCTPGTVEDFEDANACPHRRKGGQHFCCLLHSSQSSFAIRRPGLTLETGFSERRSHTRRNRPTPAFLRRGFPGPRLQFCWLSTAPFRYSCGRQFLFLATISLSRTSHSCVASNLFFGYNPPTDQGGSMMLWSPPS